MEQICDDLEGETLALAAIVENLTEEQWRLPTVAEGWDSHETVLHLGVGDWFAHLTLTDRQSFLKARERLWAGEASLHELADPKVHTMSGDALWEWFKDRRREVIAAFRSLDVRERIVWIGPDIGARSMATGRLVESWTHSQDLADTFGVSYPRTDRLRHIAHLAVVARGFSYANRGMTPPEDPVRVELTGPSGALWVWGPEEAANIVCADAYEFCKVVTRRQAVADSAVEVRGDLALEWMEIAQPWIEPPRISDRA